MILFSRFAICHQSSSDHLIRSRQHVRRNRQTNLLGGFQINNQLEFGRLLDGQVGRFSSFENLVHIVCEAPVLIVVVRRVGHKVRPRRRTHFSRSSTAAGTLGQGP